MAKPFKSVCYCTNARRLANILTEYYDRALAPAAVNTAQFCLLRNLERLRQGNLTAWAEQTGIERSTMVRNAKRLEQLGLVKQVDGRGKVYTLSDAGLRCLESGGVLWEKAQRDIEAVLGEEGAAALLTIGKKIQSL